MASDVEHLFYVPICHPYIFSEISLHIFCPFSNWIVCGVFLLLSFENSLYNLYTSSLLDDL